MATYTTVTVTNVRHWSDKLFSFTTTREPGLRFENGQFIMVGLEVDGRRIVRAYSIASANHEDELEFYSIKVPDGPLTSRLKEIRAGETVLLSAKPTGTLVIRDLRAGKRLFLLSTGTGFAPFASLIKDPEVYDRFEQVILVRGARHITDLAYGDEIVERVRQDPYIGDLVRAQLLDYPTVTREPHVHNGRVTAVLESGQLSTDLGIAPLDRSTDRVMICGSKAMLQDCCELLNVRGFEISARVGSPGDYVIERAFVDS
ncbi:MAG: ferredoxin--NADP reductase [Proteobacteria bacterium]|nr:ferredoxin--NADP reductase [Pseudomonadota bacterium]